MYDYKLIEAFAMVVSEGGFERAGKVLYVTQSAISQRIRQLEDQCGQLLLTRSSPPQPTAAGRAMLKHYQQVKLLEEGVNAELSAAEESGPTSLAIGINADSLASWFLDSIRPMLRRYAVFIDLRVDDQEQTHQYLRDGEVIGCISNEPRAMQGCRVEFLGEMTYRLLASADFIERWFPEGVSLAAVKHAPAVIFNRNDRLHQQFLAKILSAAPAAIPCHYVPAPEQFLRMITDGYSYGMVPDWQSRMLRDEGKLLELVTATAYPVELYWHCWNLHSQPLEYFSQQLVNGARQLLKGG